MTESVYWPICVALQSGWSNEGSGARRFDRRNLTGWDVSTRNIGITLTYSTRKLSEWSDYYQGEAIVVLEDENFTASHYDEERVVKQRLSVTDFESEDPQFDREIEYSDSCRACSARPLHHDRALSLSALKWCLVIYTMHARDRL